MTVLIGLHGRLGAGKDTAFEGIHKWASERGVRAARRGFADALKLSFARLFIPDCGLDEAVNWCNTLKGHESASRLAMSWGVFSEHGTDTTIEHSITGRQALQRYGTEGHRDVFGEDFWVDALLPTDSVPSETQFEYQVHRSVEPVPVQRWPMNFRQEMDFSVEPPEICVVTDVRFVNEATRIRTLKGINWKVVRPIENGGLGDNEGHHASELDLPTELIDHVILNNSSIDDLHSLIDDMMTETYGEVFA